MLPLTRHERLVLIFLVFVFLVGTTLHHLFEANPRLKSFLNVLESDSFYVKVDLNRATEKELIDLPWIGQVTAQRFLAYRDENGHFKNLEELKNVKGIGYSQYQRLKKYLFVKPASL